MPKKPLSTPVRKPVAKKAGRKTVVRKTVKKAAKKTGRKTTRKTVKKTAAKKRVRVKPEKNKRPRAKVINEHPDNIAVDPHDHVAVEALDHAKAARKPRKPRPNAVDMAADPPQAEAGATSMVERVSDAIERELTKIERIVGNPARMHPDQRVETESRARVLASLARTLKEVMRLREQERGAGDDKARAADDDAVPRDLDEFRRELSRRLEGMLAGRAQLSAGGNELG